MRLPCTLLVMLVLAVTLSAQDVPGPQVRPDRLVVKLREGSGARLQDGKLTSRTGQDLARAEALFARAKAVPAITAASPELLDEWHERAVAAAGKTQPPGNLNLWFYLQLADAPAADALLAELQACELVEHAYREPIFRPCCSVPLTPNPVPGDIPPPTPDYRSLQLYHGPSPNGLGTTFLQAIVGGRGHGVTVISVEDDWLIGHEDLDKVNAAAFIGPVAPGNTGEVNHGTAGSSLLCANRNNYGITGACDEVTLRLIVRDLNGGVPNSVIAAATACQPGDVIMLVLQFLLGQLGTTDWVPIEYFQLEFDACATATANGRLMVSSCANGGRSLDDPRHLRRFDRGFRDSHAIFAGASDGVNLNRAWYSNYGSRLDANAWGENGAACGYGTLFFPNNDLRQSYTGAYAGTSLSVPLVTAAVAQLQGAARQQLGRSLTQPEYLQLFHTFGVPGPDTIGTRPDLRATALGLGILDGLELGSPDVAPGGSVDVIVSGPVGGAGFLFAGFTLQNTSVGLNRPVHLSLGTLTTVGFLPLGAGSVHYTLAVPNDPLLQGTDLYFQAGTLAPLGGPVHVTNSCQVTVW
jgi:serine protease